MELARCTGRACSRSHSLDLYRQAFSQGHDVAQALIVLEDLFDDFHGEVQGRRVIITYASCGCPLVEKGLVSSPGLCLCSQESLRYNWESIFGEGRIQVRTLETVLRGDECCRFEVILPEDDS